MTTSNIVLVTLKNNCIIEYKADGTTVRDGVLLIVRYSEEAEELRIIAIYAEGQWKSAAVI